jgi:hypothetical protein
MDLISEIRKTALDPIRNGDFLAFNMYAKQNSETLKKLYAGGIIDDSSLVSALEDHAVNMARRIYEGATSAERPDSDPDHLGMPGYLAYALDNGIFTPEQVERIPFRVTPEDFIQSHKGKDLIGRLKNELLNPKKVEFSGRCDSGHCACSGAF